MQRLSRSGCKVTYAPFWLVWLPPSDGGPERFPHLRISRPRSGNGEPLTEREALDYWLHSAVNYCTATEESIELLEIARDSR
jgi:hypothetical protein